MTPPSRASLAPRQSPLPGILAVTATYVYFLLFAQFGFLRILQGRLGTTADIEGAMAAMGITGLLTSFAAAPLLKRIAARRLLAVGFVGAALAALLALAADGRGALMAVAAAIGAAAALVTVPLAAELRDLVRGRHFGLGVGVGTGLAYLICNLPPIFEGSVALQAGISAAACLLGLAAVLRTSGKASEAGPRTALRPRDVAGWGFASVVVSFLALIWLDSAAFAVIQETAALKALTWGDGPQELIQGSVHLLAAVAAGRLIDRGHFRSLLLATFALFAVAFPLLEGGAGGLVVLAGPLYAVGISIYSTALVAYPSYLGDGPGRVPRRYRAALVYGVAGWIGSALGVGMAQDLHRVPAVLLVAAGSLLLLAWIFGRGGRAAHLVRAHALTLAFTGAAVVLYAVHPAVDTTVDTAITPAVETISTDADTSSVAHGRQVYIQEGCIHCHSQYVRPRTADAELWGPPRDAQNDTPPLYGNRRQGPDLSNAGNRRSAPWHRLHLADPRSLAPASRMPSYDHLFADDSRRGDDLVAYLASLGTKNQEPWYAGVRAIDVGTAAHDGSPAPGRKLFGDYCAPCHGAVGRGDGPLAAEVYRPAMNLQKGAFWLIDQGTGDAEPRREGLARLIKFGMPGTSMPGHEYLTDDQIADLVAFVDDLAAVDQVAEIPADTTADTAADAPGSPQ